MKKIKNNYLNFVIIAVCVILEILISNRAAISLAGSEYNLVALSEAASSDISASYSNGQLKINKGTVEFFDIDTEMKNLCVTLSGKDKYIPLTVAFTDDNFAFKDGYDYNKGTFKVLVGDEEKNYLNLNSFGNVKNLRLDFGDEKVTIDKLELNKKPEFSFNILRFVIIAAVCFIVKYGLWKIKFDNKNHSYAIMVSAAVLCAVILISFGILSVGNAKLNVLSVYPNLEISSADEYEQLFDAFKKGQLNLDIDYDTSEFENLDNVYDRSERNEYDLHGDFWDRAYYNGKFYSYFGIAPVFTVYFPVYFFTHKVPTTEFASTLLCIYAVIFISLLYDTIIKKMCRKVPLLLVLLGYITVIMTSGIMAVMCENKFYYIAILSGIGSVAAFLFFLLKAYYSDSFKKRNIFLIMTGISVVMIVASRPTLLLYALVAVVPAVFVFKNKKESIYQKMIYIVSIATPVLMGAVLIMLYNYLRFDSPFEFGFNYQLTVSIAKANTITLGMVPAALYHFYIQQPKIHSSFPYIEIKTYALDSYSRYSYAHKTMGVLNYPIINAVFLYPFAVNKDKKDRFKKYFTIAVIACAVLLSFIDMCKAGSHYRYTIDILFTLVIAALIIVFELLAKIEEIMPKKYSRAYILTAVIMGISISLGYLMIFANENNFLLDNFPMLAGYHF